MESMNQQLTGPVSSNGQLAPIMVNTLADVLKDPILNEEFGGKDRRLSPAQAGLATAVALKMQDRLINQIEKAHNREISLISGLWRLYKTPVINMPSAKDGVQPEAGPPKKSGFSELFSWGNLVGGAAIILVAISFYYTKLTANYERHWRDAESQVEKLQGELTSAQRANEALEGEFGDAKERAEVAEGTLRNLSNASIDQQLQLISVIKDLGHRRGKLAKQVAASSSERTFQRLYETAVDDLGNLRE